MTEPTEAELLRADLATLREVVADHRATILHQHLRWGSGPDHPEGECEDPEDCSHLPQITTADRELWVAAGLDPRPKLYYRTPVERLLATNARLQDRLADAGGAR